MSAFAEALVAAARGRRRVRQVELWAAFRAVHPVEATAGDARERLMVRLHALAGERRITLPAARSPAWDRSARPPIPEWVALPRPIAAPSAVDVTAVAWAPELAFVPTTPGLTHLADALAVQRFFAAGGRSRPLVPLRERSVELFGDEKRLERLVRTPLFGPGRLDLAQVRCFGMAPPLVFEAGVRGAPCLVVENHHTWWSFCRWNGRTGAYSAVVYGAGGGFGRDAVAFLAERCAEWGTRRAEYFGDLDRDGLVIPWRAATQFTIGSALQIVPAVRWYELLVARAEAAALPAGPPIEVERECLAWLPEGLQARVKERFARGVRVPQELVGTEQLLEQRPPASPDPDVPF